MGQVCFGVEPCPDGSVVVASQHHGDVSVTRVAPGSTQSAQVVELVRNGARAPRICVAAHNGRGLNLALALGKLDDAEVILLRPSVLVRQEPLAVALATYARRAA